MGLFGKRSNKPADAAMRWLTDYAAPQLGQLERSAREQLQANREQILASSRAAYRDPVVPPAEAVVALRESGLQVVLARRPDITISAPFEVVHQIARHDTNPVFHVLMKGFMTPLELDQTNPDDESEFALVFGPNDGMIDQIVDEYGEWDWRQRSDRVDCYATRLETPVAEWPDCPMCRGQLRDRVVHAARCEPCDILFADAEWEPKIDGADATYGTLTGVSERILLVDEMHLRGSVRPWVPRPRQYTFGPMTVPFHELERRVRGRAGLNQEP